MTDRETKSSNTGGTADSPPEELELRAKPAPITRINRKVLFGVVFVGLFFLAGLVIVALNPPRFTAKAPSELYNVDQKAVGGMARGAPQHAHRFGRRTRLIEQRGIGHRQPGQVDDHLLEIHQ